MLESNEVDRPTIFRKLSVFIIVGILFILDRSHVRRDGNYIILGDAVLDTITLFLLFMLALSLVALMRPMESKNYMKN
ncbi:MAG: hypothetical protein ACXAC2_16470 [Candidatus Kariarchaeaceae archaeon]